MSGVAAAARTEADGRTKYYPGMVAAGELSPRDAEHDWRCWQAISEWVADPSRHPHLSEWDLTWSDLVAAARRALARREEALASASDSDRTGLEMRRDGVRSVLIMIEHRANLIASINEELRAVKAKAVAA